MSSLKFTVKENDKLFPVCEMTEPECAAIEECVNDLIPSFCENRHDYWLEPDLCLLEEDEEMPSYGLLCCYTHNPNPKNGSLAESRIPHPLPKEVLDQLAGKTFLVNPRQLGLSPWGNKVEVVFEAVAPVRGVKASVLIAAALKQ